MNYILCPKTAEDLFKISALEALSRSWITKSIFQHNEFAIHLLCLHNERPTKSTNQLGFLKFSILKTIAFSDQAGKRFAIFRELWIKAAYVKIEIPIHGTDWRQGKMQF